MLNVNYPNKNKQVMLGLLRDIVSRANIDANPFLHKLADFFENNILKPVSLKGYLVFAENAIQVESSDMVIDALKILNKLIDPESGNLLSLTPDMLEDNRYFKWKEFGSHRDPISVISHIVNKCALVLNLGK
ncbi:MAG: hypothetical protein AAB874_08110 [Patescibacteria group bacterium]